MYDDDWYLPEVTPAQEAFRAFEHQAEPEYYSSDEYYPSAQELFRISERQQDPEYYGVHDTGSSGLFPVGQALSGVAAEMQRGSNASTATAGGPGGGAGYTGGILSASGSLKDRLATALKNPNNVAGGLASLYNLLQATRGADAGRTVHTYAGKVSKKAPAARVTRAPAPRAYGAGAQGQNYFAEGGEVSQDPYLQGATDGMADDVPASIGKDIPAKLSHGEFVIPADVVSGLGNGNSDAGALHLRKMMENVRKARTGTKKQGKKINPEKFVKTAFATGDLVADPTAPTAATTTAAAPESSTTTQTSSLADWAGDYVTDMLGTGWGLAEQPYAAYQGQLTAGTSPLQQQGFDAASSLTTSPTFGQAADTAGQVADAAGSLSYAPSSFSPTSVTGQNYTANTFGGAQAGPAALTSGQGYNAVTGTAATAGPAALAQTTNATAATSSYDPTRGLQTFQMGPADQIRTDKFDTQQANAYMSPYIQKVLDIQQREAQRQADMETLNRNALAVQRGAYGGSRSAIMDAEARRNLALQKGDIQAQGLQSAFTNAQGQFNADQARGLTAAQANQGANLAVGKNNLDAKMGTQQLGLGQRLQMELANLGNRQQTGLQNAQMQNQLAQFNAGAQNQLAQFNAGNQQNMGLANLQARNQAAQFGAGAQNQASQFNAGAQNQLSQFNAGNLQQAGITNAAARNQAAQFGAGQNLQAQLANQQAQQWAQQAGEGSRQFGANYGLQGLNTQLQAAQAQGSLANMGQNAGLANLQAQLTAGAQQRGIETDALTAERQQFEQQRDAPYKQVQFMQSLLGGLPIGAYNTQVNAPTSGSNVAGGITDALALYKLLYPDATT